jgi:hypothetical protein
VTRKSIQTNGPVVSCDVCGRTLLRGENSDVFLHGGSRRIVCELCTARAAHEGWIREGLDDATVRSRPGGRGSRSLFGRLLSRRPQPRGPEPEVDAAGGETYEAAPPPPPRVPELPIQREPRNVHAVPTNADLKMARALDVFNGSAHPRTVSGVGRSLGAPIVSVRPSATEGSVVSVVVGWELSWYRYEVDLADEAAGPRVVAQGAELAELDPADQIPNAAADDTGQLHLVPQPA